MTTRTTETPQVSLPIYEDRIRKELELERQRMLDEAGIKASRPQHFKRPVERPFLRTERDKVTVLFGGFTLRHERLIQAALEGLGYKIGLVATPKKADFQAGKEFGNNGQCNPTYFTVGALVNHLRDLRDNQGMKTEDIIENFAFITAGACGPCRFGMYEAEYRLALRNSGFDGFRVMLFDQSGGLNQADLERGFEFNFDFMLSLLNGIFLGDLLNEVAYHIRPYEVVPGSTDKVFDQAVETLRTKLRSKTYADIKAGTFAKLLSKVTPVDNEDMAEKFLDQLKSNYYTSACEEIARLVDEQVEVDYTRARPVVKVTGEFWAQTTEGDGNFNMFPFLEREGAEVLVEPISTWVSYLLHQAICKTNDSRGIKEGEAPPEKWDVVGKLKAGWKYHSKIAKLNVAGSILKREYERIRKSLGGTAHELACQKHLERIGHPYYHTRLGGGEGHLEVAKAIYYSSKKYAHMVLSLKPFGCMPSTQSDGAQAAVVSHFNDLIYIPIETSGEGDVNAHSRVQMALGEAKVKSRAEFNAEVQKTGFSIDQIREFIARPENRDLRRPIKAMQMVPHYDDVIGRATKFVRFVGQTMGAAENSASIPHTRVE